MSAALLRAKVKTAVELRDARLVWEWLHKPGGRALASELLLEQLGLLDRLLSAVLPYEVGSEREKRRLTLASLFLSAQLSLGAVSCTDGVAAELLRSLKLAADSQGNKMSTTARQQLPGITPSMLQRGCSEGNSELVAAAVEAGADCSGAIGPLEQAIATRRVSVQAVLGAPLGFRAELYQALPPREQAEMLAGLSRPSRMAMFHAVPIHTRREMLLQPELRPELLAALLASQDGAQACVAALPDSELGAVLGEAQAEDRARLLAAVSPDQQEVMANQMSIEQQQAAISGTSVRQQAAILAGAAVPLKAALFNQLRPCEQQAAWEQMPSQHKPGLFSALDTQSGERLVRASPAAGLAGLFVEMDSLGQSRLLELMSPDQLHQGFEALPPAHKPTLYLQLPPTHQANLLANTSPVSKAQLFDQLPPDKMQTMLSQIGPAAAAQMFSRQSQKQQAALLDATEPRTQLGILEQLSEPDQRTLLAGLQIDSMIRLLGCADQPAKGTIIARLSLSSKAALIQRLPESERAEALTAMSTHDRVELFVHLEPIERGKMLGRLTPTQQALLFSGMSEVQQGQMLEAMPSNADRAAVFSMLASNWFGHQQAALLNQIAVQERVGLVVELGVKAKSELLALLQPSDVVDLFKQMSEPQQASMVGAMRAAAVAALLLELPEKQQKQLLAGLALEPERKAEIMQAVPPEHLKAVLAVCFDVVATASMLVASAPQERARMLDAIGAEEQKLLMLQCTSSQRKSILPVMSHEAKRTLVCALSREQLSKMLNPMTCEEHIDLIRTLPQSQQSKVLDLLSVEQQAALFVSAGTPAQLQAQMVAALSSTKQMAIWRQLSSADTPRRNTLLSLCEPCKLLEAAVAAQDVQLVSAVLGRGAPVDCPGVLQLTPLQLCAVIPNCSIELVTHLLSARARLQAPSSVAGSNRCSALDLALSNAKGCTVATELLEIAGDTDLWNAMQCVSSVHPLSAVLANKCLLRNHFGEARIPAVSKLHQQAELQALVWEETNSSYTAGLQQLEEDQIELQAMGHTLLGWSVYFDHKDLVDTLLKRKDQLVPVAQLVCDWIGFWGHVSQAVHKALLQQAPKEAAERAMEIASCVANEALNKAAIECKIQAVVPLSSTGVDPQFPPQLCSLCPREHAQANHARYMQVYWLWLVRTHQRREQVKWVRAPEIDGLHSNPKRDLIPPAPDAVLEPGKFGSLFYWSAMLLTLEGPLDGYRIIPRNSSGRYHSSPYLLCVELLARAVCSGASTAG